MQNESIKNNNKNGNDRKNNKWKKRENRGKK